MQSHDIIHVMWDLDGGDGRGLRFFQNLIVPLQNSIIRDEFQSHEIFMPLELTFGIFVQPTITHWPTWYSPLMIMSPSIYQHPPLFSHLEPEEGIFIEIWMQSFLSEKLWSFFSVASSTRKFPSHNLRNFFPHWNFIAAWNVIHLKVLPSLGRYISHVMFSGHHM